MDKWDETQNSQTRLLEITLERTIYLRNFWRLINNQKAGNVAFFLRGRNH